MDWQTIVALSLVAVAGLALLPRILRLFDTNPKPGCGGCGGGCSQKTEKIVQKPLIEVGNIKDLRK